MSAPAFAVFTRPLIGQLEGTPSGPFPGLSGGLTVYTTGSAMAGTLEEGIVVGTPGEKIDEFNSSNIFVSPQLTCPDQSLAFDDRSEKLECAGASEWVAVDNSTDLAAGDVYRATRGGGTVARFNDHGEPQDFECPEPHSSEYVVGNELTGRPGEQWGSAQVEGVAVDSVDSGTGPSEGDIYVINNSKGSLGAQVDEFSPDGCFLGVITGRNVKVEHDGKEEEVELFDGDLSGITVDPSGGDVLIEAFPTGSVDGEQVIDEFTGSRKYLGQVAGTSQDKPFESFALESGAIAVTYAGDLYVGNGDVVDEFGPGAIYPRVVTGEATDDQSTAAMLTGTVNDEDVALTGCSFEYVTKEAFKKTGFENLSTGGSMPCVPVASSVPVDLLNHEVQGEATRLESGKIYDYRLVATTDPGDHGGMKYGEVASFAAAAKPTVEGVAVGDVSSSFVDFHAKIDPLGADTAYYFEYVDAAGYEGAVAEDAVDPYSAGGRVPLPAGDVGSGDGYVSVSVQAGSLSPGTVYHYRVVASNGVGVTDGSDGVFATVPAGLQGLPDGRAYEMLTPVNKGDGEDLFGGPPDIEAQKNGEASSNYDLGYASEDGDHFLLLTAAAFGPFPSSGQSAYVLSRGENGWSFQSVASPSLGVQSVSSLVFDPLDFSVVGVSDYVGYNNEQSMVLDGPPGGPYVTVASRLASGPSRVPIEFAGASEDLSHVVVEGHDHELPVCESAEEGLARKLDEGSSGLYEWSTVRQCLSLVDVKSGSDGSGLVSECGAVLGVGYKAAGWAHDAVSADGSKVFFTAPDPFASGLHCSASDPPQVYMRLNGETTVEVSARENGGAPKYPAVFVGAAADGSKVFFVTRSELTKDAVQLGTREPELYEYDAEAPEGERLIRVSRGDSGSGPVEGDVTSVVAISADGSAVYFDASGDLAPGGEHGGLYRYDTNTGVTSFVALEQGYPSAESSGGGAPWYNEAIHDNGSEVALDLHADYYTTPDGEFLLFGPYRYDAATGSIVCVMCNPDGAGPIRGASFTRSAVRGDNPAGGPPSPMSENGEYVFFDAAEPLVPQATNGKLDVYEWHDGVISLIGSGEDPSNSYFLDSSSYIGSKGEAVEGGNVFFGTHAKLVPQDIDTEGDLYDARIGGGFSVSTDSGPCEGDACLNQSSPPPAQTPATLTTDSSGNFAAMMPSTIKKKTATKRRAAGCPKGKRMSRGKCIRDRSVGSRKARRIKSRKVGV
jgi:hypothetical protein